MQDCFLLSIIRACERTFSSDILSRQDRVSRRRPGRKRLHYLGGVCEDYLGGVPSRATSSQDSAPAVPLIQSKKQNDQISPPRFPNSHEEVLLSSGDCFGNEDLEQVPFLSSPLFHTRHLFTRLCHRHKEVNHRITQDRQVNQKTITKQDETRHDNT